MRGLVVVMKKYNLSSIMKRAWVIFKKLNNFSESLKLAWKEARIKMKDRIEAAKTLKEKIIEYMNLMCDKLNASYVYNYELNITESIGKRNITYLKIYRTTCISGVTFFDEYDCGYYDNISEIYVPGEINIRSGYGLYGDFYYDAF